MKHTGKVHFHFKTVSSTNDLAADILSKTSPISGTAISADFQSRGRGQFDRKWQGAMDQNLAVTVIYLPVHLEILHQFYLNKCVALAVRECVASFVKNDSVTRIKWPNDILVNGQKISGILIQNSLQGPIFKNSIIGIGMNVLQKEWDGLEIKPTSIVLNSDVMPDKYKILQSLFHFLDQYLSLLEQNKLSEINEQYDTHLYKLGQLTKVIIYNEYDEVWIKGVDPFGRMGVEKSGRTAFLDYGSLKILYDDLPS